MCIKVYCCSLIEDHRRSVQVTVGFRADFVLLNNMLYNVSKQGALSHRISKQFFKPLVCRRQKKRSITGAGVHLNRKQVDKHYDIILCLCRCVMA